MVRGGHDGCRHRRLTLPVELDEPRAEHLERAPEIGRRERRAPVHDLLQRRQRGRVVTDVVEQHHDLRGDHPGVGHACFRDEVEDGGGVEPGIVRDHLVRGACRRRQRVEPGTVRQRRRVQGHVVLVHRGQVGQPRRRREREIAVGEDRALGTPGRTRRVEQPGHVVAVHGHGRGCVVGRRNQLVVCVCTVGDAVGRDAGHDDAYALTRGRGRTEHDVRALDVREHGDRAGVVHVVRDLVGGEAAVQRDETEPTLEAGEHRLEHLGPVAHEHADAVTTGRAEVGERAGQRVRAAIERRVVEPPIAPGHCLPVGMAARRVRQQLAHVHGLIEPRVAAGVCRCRRGTPSRHLGLVTVLR